MRSEIDVQAGLRICVAMRMPGLAKTGRCLLALAVVLLASQAYAKPKISLQHIADGLWLHTSHYSFPGMGSFPSNGLLLRDGDGLILIDTAWGELQTVELLEVIADQIDLPLRFAVVTHAHGDRAGGVDVLEARGIPVYAHPQTQKLAMASGVPVPDRVIDGLERRGASVKLGPLLLYFPGPAHAPDNLMVWLAEEKLLYGGCAVRGAGASSVGNTAHSDLSSWGQAMDEVMARFPAAKTVVPGHGKWGGPELLLDTQRLVLKAQE